MTQSIQHTAVSTSVHMGEFLTHVTIWTSLFAYAAGEAGRVNHGLKTARLVWSCGCVLYLLHVATAFHVHHGWSHASAYTHTAEQTSAFVGVLWGSGIYANYAFTAIWVGEVAWWWLSPLTYRNRPRELEVTVRAVFLFMIGNGAVVFVEGPMRWLGLGLFVAVGSIWWNDVNRRRARP